MLWAILAAVLLVVWLVLALCRVTGETNDEYIAHTSPPVMRPASEETTMHEHEPIEPPKQDDSDVYLLAKIMRAESGIDWPDWAVMAIGEVVLNRVESPFFPDTIHDVLYQTGPIQYAPVWEDGWDTMEPDTDYINLARRLMDGERVFYDQDVIWQALFQQGNETVIAYYDKALGSTTYFCK